MAVRGDIVIPPSAGGPNVPTYTVTRWDPTTGTIVTEQLQIITLMDASGKEVALTEMSRWTHEQLEVQKDIRAILFLYYRETLRSNGQTGPGEMLTMTQMRELANDDMVEEGETET